MKERPKFLSPLNALKTINKEAVEKEITISEIMFIIFITDFSFLEKKYFRAKKRDIFKLFFNWVFSFF